MSKHKSQIHHTAQPSAGATKREVWKLAVFPICMLLAFAFKMYSRFYAPILYSQSACATPSADPTPLLYSRVYSPILNWTRNENATQVAEIVIPADLVDIQQNVCRGRAYLADLLRALDTRRPSVIVLDKYFSPDACAMDPGSTARLVKAVTDLKTPVVVGDSTDTAAREVSDSCLVQKKQLDLGANVHHGLTRLNVNKEEIPLEWNVLPRQPSDDRVTSVPALSLALVAARTMAKQLIDSRRIQDLREAERQPYAYFRDKFPRESSTQLLCEAGTPADKANWALHCSGTPPTLDLLGKVVVVGAESDADSVVALGRRMYGYELQATYIEALLSGRYMRAPSSTIVFWCYVVFLLVLEAPIILSVYRKTFGKPSQSLASSSGHHRRWAILWTGLFVLVMFLAYFLAGYLPPLLMLSGAVTTCLFCIIPDWTEVRAK